MKEKRCDSKSMIAAAAISEVAENQGTTETSVRSGLLEAMKAGMSSSDPRTQVLWDSFVFAGEEPTAEEFLLWITQLVSERLPG